MSYLTTSRSWQIVRYLKTHPAARFTELLKALAPVSRTSLSKLLQNLCDAGELQKKGRLYALNPASSSLGSYTHGIYALSPELRRDTQPILEACVAETAHSCALFGWVGTSTMRILDVHNLPEWPFQPVGYEWPLVPFHGFAQVFLAFGPELLARDCYFRWFPYLQPAMAMGTYQDFLAVLARIRASQHAIEYRGEVPTILRIVVPVRLPGERYPRYACGLTANAIFLLEAEKCLSALRKTAALLSSALTGRVPLFSSNFEEELPLRKFDDPWPTIRDHTRKLLPLTQRARGLVPRQK